MSRSAQDGGAGSEDEDDGRNVALLIVIGLVGVFLLIPVVIVTAAVLGTFVLGIGTDTGPVTPSASFDLEYSADEGTATVTHVGGDTFREGNTQRLTVVVEDTERSAVALPFSAGDAATVAAEPGDRIELVWTDPDDGETETVAVFTVAEG